MYTKYFKREEFLCKGKDCNCGFDAVDVDLLEILIDIRHHFGRPVTINSACRCAKHNESVGGVETSMHLVGKAADISVEYYTPEQVYDYVSTKYPSRFGIGLYKTFVHIDVRPIKVRW